MRQAVAFAGKPIEIIVLRRPAAVFLLGYELTPPGSAIQPAPASNLLFLLNFSVEVKNN